MTGCGQPKQEQVLKPSTIVRRITGDEKVGSMGDRTCSREGRETKLCGSGFLEFFKKNPSKYVKKLEKAEKKAAKK